MIPKEFFLEEVKNDFTVTSKRKKVWATEIDLLREFDRVCKENNIKYMVAYGTMLGAVRHKGFIPWDDDIDVVLFREDYNRLMKIGPKSFEGKYFFQTYTTDKNYYRTHAQLRNSETTAILDSEITNKKSFNQGIFIDIFPLDGYPEDNQKVEKLKKKVSNLLSTIAGYEGYNSYKKHSFLGKLRQILLRIVNIKTVLWYFNRVCSKYSSSNTKYICDIALTMIKDISVWEKEKIYNTQEYQFEYTSVVGPREYDYYLKTLYGDYSVLIKDGNLHGNVFFNTEKPYTYYLDEGREELEEYATAKH